MKGCCSQQRHTEARELRVKFCLCKIQPTKFNHPVVRCRRRRVTEFPPRVLSLKKHFRRVLGERFLFCNPSIGLRLDARREDFL
jgi:hypothetical protein